MANGDHLIPCGDAGGEKREVQRVIAAVHTHCVPGADELCQVALELFQLLTKHQIASSECLGERGVNLRLEPPIVLVRVHERNSIAHNYLLLTPTTPAIRQEPLARVHASPAGTPGFRSRSQRWREPQTA